MEPATDPIEALRACLGSANVAADAATRAQYESATFQTEQRVSAVVYPDSTAEVQAVVALARRFGLALYPISRGRNWGLGSRVPTRDESVVVDLRRMNRIVDFDEQLSCVTVEPGVTFQQLADFLESKGSGLYLSVIGGPPDASVLGNTLERGDGLGPLGDRCESSCALEAVLGTGECVRTGMGMFGPGPMSGLMATGLGPEISGLLFQSNFAIVTRLTLWLARIPEEFQGVAFAIKDPAALAPAVAALRELQQRGVLKANSFALWNPQKFLASIMQYPFAADGRALASPEQLLSHLPPALRGAHWIGMAALYSASKLHARADRRLLRQLLGPHVARLAILGRSTASWLRFTRPFAAKVLGMDPDQMLRLLYSESPFLGHPTKFSSQSVYWRKRGPKAPELDPDRDRCGLHWVCTAIPFEHAHLAKHAAIVERVALGHELEPNLSYLNLSERCLKSFAVIAFDRDADDEESRARRCHDQMLRELSDAGYPPVRLGIQSMDKVTPADTTHIELVRRLKRLFDPLDVIASGHYDFRHAWMVSDGDT
ncbi:MAG TPA: FAD-dependent oxidoreductase [Polyangiales bacterium]